MAITKRYFFVLGVDDDQGIVIEEGFGATSEEWLERFKGEDGSAGSAIRNGTGAPANDFGSVNDFYIDRNVMRIYGPKTAGASPWGTGFLLPGPAGQNGSTMRFVTATPASSLGANGDFAIESDGSLYVKENGAWSLKFQFSLVGATPPPDVPDPPDPEVTPSAAGTTVPTTADQIIATDFAVWTLGAVVDDRGSQVLINGVWDGTTIGTTIYIDASGVIWHGNAFGLWFKWVGGTWIFGADPRSNVDLEATRDPTEPISVLSDGRNVYRFGVPHATGQWTIDDFTNDGPSHDIILLGQVLATLGKTQSDVVVDDDGSSGVRITITGTAFQIHIGQVTGFTDEFLVAPYTTTYGPNECPTERAFDDAYWGKTGLTVTANALASADGSMTADRLVELAVNNAHQIFHQEVTFVQPGRVYRIELEAKDRGRHYLEIGMDQFAFPLAPWGRFDVSASGALAPSTQSPNVAAIADLGNGWRNCILDVSPTTAGWLHVVLSEQSAFGTGVFQGNTGLGIDLGRFSVRHFWGVGPSIVTDVPPADWPVVEGSGTGTPSQPSNSLPAIFNSMLADPGFNTDQLRHYSDAEWVNFKAHCGFVRMFDNWNLVPPNATPDFATRTDFIAQINKALSHGFKVIVVPFFGNDVQNWKPQAKTYWVSMATYINAHWAKEDVCMALCNEPVVNVPNNGTAAQIKSAQDQWLAIVLDGLSVIRPVMPNHCIVVPGNAWSAFEYWPTSNALTDPLVIHEFHCYNPWAFCNQGATWLAGAPAAGSVSYTANQAAAQQALQAFIDWKNSHSVMAMMGEVGSTIFAPNIAMRAAHAKDYIQVCKAAGMPAAVWQDCPDTEVAGGSFGIYDPTKTIGTRDFHAAYKAVFDSW